MSKNYQDVIALVKQMSGQKAIIAVPRIYIRVVGDPIGGMFLSQIVYHADKTKRADGYFYRTAAQWKDDLELSKFQVKRWRDKLVLDKLITTKKMMANGSPTIHYKPLMEEIVRTIIDQLEESRKSINFTFESKETSLSESKETLPSITERKKELQKIDPLSFSLQGAEDNSLEDTSDQWMQFGDEACDVYQQLTGGLLGKFVSAQVRLTRRNLITTITGDDFKLPVWRKAIEQSLAVGVGPANIARFIEVYKLGGEYQTWYDKKYKQAENDDRYDGDNTWVIS